VVVLGLSLLGPPVVLRDGVPVSFDTRKAVALLALLAVEDHDHSRARLAALFWPESEEDKARSALRRTLSVTAAAVGDALVVDRAAVHLRPEACTSDVRDFVASATAIDSESLQRAASLYRDDFMAGFTLRDAPDFDDWLHFTATGLRQQFAAVLGRLVALAVSSGDLDAATGHARRWLAAEPLHEPAHQALIRLYAWTGQRSAALQQFRACVGVLDRELGVGPLHDTVALADAVRAARLAPPPRPAADTPPASISTTALPAAASATAPAVTEAPLVGRDDTLTAIRNAVASATDSGRVFEVTGPAGIGKTRILGEVAAEVRRRGGQGLVTRCHERERGLAYGLVIDLLRVASHSRPELADTLNPQTRAEVGRLVPALAGDHATSVDPLDGPGAVARLYAAITDVLVTAVSAKPGSEAPGAIVIDDAEWADSASAEWLAWLLHRAPGLAVLIAVGHAGEFAADSPLPAALAASSAAGVATVVALDPLGRDDVAAVLTDADVEVTPERLTLLHRETGGLPFLVVAYAQALRAVPVDGDALQPTPTDVRSALLARLAGVSETTQQILAGAAVLGGRVDLDLLRATTGRSESETVDAVEEAMRAGLLVELAATASGPAYDFSAAALARVVDSRTSAARRRLLHGRAADALLHRPDRSAATVAVHLHAAGRTEEAAQWHWQAASEARLLFAHAEALAQVREASALGYPPAQAHLVAGELLTTLGRYREALASYEAAAAALEADGAAREPADAQLAVVEHRLADVYHRLADYEIAESHARAALDLLEGGAASTVGAEGLADTNRTLVARVVADLAVICYRQGDDARASTIAARALATAEETGDAAAAAQALDVLGMLAVRRGDLETGQRHLLASLEQARGLADPSSAVAALNNLARLYAERGDSEGALVAAEEALTLGGIRGDRHRVAALHTNLADLMHAAGRTDEAIAHLKEAATLFAGVDDEAERRPEIWKLVQW
jgi:DNA-binding SARP family transcriptional activator/tetratricopeptide (TPR) repeat protein